MSIFTRILYVLCITTTMFSISNQNIERKTMNENNSNQALNIIDQEVTFINAKDEITLSGTLSVPENSKKSPVVILIAGYGPNDRDCTIMGRKLFVPMVQYFVQHGIAVLRYDKRGVGKSSGKYDLTFTSADFAQDVLAAVDFLKNRTDIDTKNIGLAGMSEGGLIAFIVASQSPDVAFIVSMAGATSSDAMLHAQMQLKADGASDAFLAEDKKVRTQLFEIVKTQSADDAKINLNALIKSYVDNLTDEQRVEAKNLPFAITGENYAQMISAFNSAWYRFYLEHDALDFISKVTIPVLAINGDLDFFIPAKLALPKIEQGLKMAHNQKGTIVTIPNQNHWFQECKTGAIQEYGAIQEIMAESTLKLMIDWIQKTVESLKNNK